MGNKIKVLSVCTSDTSGGAARAAYRIHRSVKSFGIESNMFVKDKKSSDADVIPLRSFVPNNMLYRAFDWIRNRIKNKCQHYRWGKYPDRKDFFMSDMRSTDICGALGKTDYDVLHLHWINQRFLPLDKLPKDKPIIWTLHDSWAFCGICHYFLDCEGYVAECGQCPHLRSKKPNDLSHRIWKRKKASYKGLDLHIVTPSRWLGDCAKKSSLLGRFPVSVIPNCLDINTFRPLENDKLFPDSQSLRRTSPDKHLILFGAVGATTDYIKGFSKLRSALAVLAESGRAEQLELIVFGGNKVLDGVPESVSTHYVGFVSSELELASLYNIASVMVVPSLTEAFGQTASEALACGTPVAAFRCTGLVDIIDHKVNGYLAEPYEPEDLAAGILWCIDNNQNGELSDNARKKATDSFASEAVGQQYAGLYKVLSGGEPVW